MRESGTVIIHPHPNGSWWGFEGRLSVRDFMRVAEEVDRLCDLFDLLLGTGVFAP